MRGMGEGGEECRRKLKQIQHFPKRYVLVFNCPFKKVFSRCMQDTVLEGLCILKKKSTLYSLGCRMDPIQNTK